MVHNRTGAGKAVPRPTCIKGKLTSKMLFEFSCAKWLFKLILKLEVNAKTSVESINTNHEEVTPYKAIWVEQIKNSLSHELYLQDIVGTTASIIYDSKAYPIADGGKKYVLNIWYVMNTDNSHQVTVLQSIFPKSFGGLLIIIVLVFKLLLK